MFFRDSHPIVNLWSRTCAVVSFCLPRNQSKNATTLRTELTVNGTIIYPWINKTWFTWSSMTLKKWRGSTTSILFRPWMNNGDTISDCMDAVRWTVFSPISYCNADFLSMCHAATPVSKVTVWTETKILRRRFHTYLYTLLYVVSIHHSYLQRGNPGLLEIINMIYFDRLKYKSTQSFWTSFGSKITLSKYFVVKTFYDTGIRTCTHPWK